MKDLHFLTANPPNAGVPPRRMTGEIHDQSSMYMRNNFPIPDEGPASFSIDMPGMATRVHSTSDLDRYELVTETIVLECAGNGRTLMSPVPDGTPWDLGGASVIEVSGVRLHEVLGEVPDTVVEVVFTGADSGNVDPEGKVPYQFSLERAAAVSDGPLLATHIGGEPLTLEHGAPMRLIVPNHYAMKSVKWLTHIEGVEEGFTGHFVEKYRYFGDVNEPEGKRVSEVQVRSLIASPADGADLAAGVVVVAGVAWTGTGSVTDVEVSADGGASWVPAQIREAQGRVAWSAEVEVQGTSTIVARATDSVGNTQPLDPRWNANGYANNVCHRVTVFAG